MNRLSSKLMMLIFGLFWVNYMLFMMKGMMFSSGFSIMYLWVLVNLVVGGMLVIICFRWVMILVVFFWFSFLCLVLRVLVRLEMRF